MWDELALHTDGCSHRGRAPSSPKRLNAICVDLGPGRRTSRPVVYTVMRSIRLHAAPLPMFGHRPPT